MLQYLDGFIPRDCIFFVSFCVLQGNARFYHTASLAHMHCTHDIVHSHVLKVKAAYSVERKERAFLHRMYFTLLNCMCSNDFSLVLTSPENLPHLQKVMATVMSGCLPKTSEDILVAKTCFKILHELSSAWIRDGSFKDKVIRKFILQDVTKQTLACCKTAAFDFKDAGANTCMTTMVETQKLCTHIFGGEYLDFFGASLVREFQCPVEAVKQYFGRLKNGEPLMLKRELKAFMEPMKLKIARASAAAAAGRGKLQSSPRR